MLLGPWREPCYPSLTFQSVNPRSGKEWSYLRGGLTTIDRDYGIFHRLTHDIGTHVVHHLFPQIPHYNLRWAAPPVPWPCS